MGRRPGLRQTRAVRDVETPTPVAGAGRPFPVDFPRGPTTSPDMIAGDSEGRVSDSENEDNEKCCVRIVREPAVQMSGPMGTAIISRVPSFRVRRHDEEKAVFCTISHLAERLEACGLTPAAIEDAIIRAEALEDPGDWIEVEI